MAARLDRALVNFSWMSHSRDPIVHHLPRISSDHSPILLSHHTQAPLPYAPFKFENKWLLHSSFLDTVKSSWDTPIDGDPQFTLAQKLKALKQTLKLWSKSTYDNLLQNIKAVEEKSYTINFFLTQLHQIYLEMPSS